jgi:PAS domain S-box-containing protein
MKSEKKYRENMLFLQQLMDDIPVAILYTDISGKLLGCNSEFERLTGINADSCIDMSIYEIIPPQIWDSADIPQSGQSTCTREMQYERKDSKKRCVVLYKADYCDLHGEKRGYIGAVLDVTEKKALEDRLRLSEKLEAIGLLASGIAHDFNNNLMVIMGCANLLEHSVNEEEFNQCKNGIIRASRYSADLVKSLLDFAKLGKRKSLDVDIHSVIGEVVSALKPLIGERVAIMQLLEASDFVISGDPSQIFNALFNLSINSKDAIRETGTLNITTSDYSINDGNTMSFPELKPGKYIKINIVDSGIGMTAETVKRIFEPFFTTKKFGEGTGMGLSIVYGTIRNHDGYIDVRSEINKGTVFEILLPVKA